MEDICKLWVSLASDGHHHSSHADPDTFLVFPHTGFMVGLPDEPGIAVDEESVPVRVIIRSVDADGLGLLPQDFADGVAICRTSDRLGGWRCERAQLLIGAGERRSVEVGSHRTNAVHPRPQAAVASLQRRPSEASAPPTPRARRWRRILLGLDPDADSIYLVDTAAVIAREHGATLVLATVGELPESSRHELEVRAALSLRLAHARERLRDLPAHEAISVAGDPSRGLLELAVDENTDLLIVGASARALMRPFAHGDALPSLLRHARIPVMVIPQRAAQVVSAPEPHHPANRHFRVVTRIPRRGLRFDRGDGWEQQLRDELRLAVHRNFRAGEMELIDVAARWSVGSPSFGRDALRHLGFRPILDGLADAGYWRTPNEHVRAILCTLDRRADSRDDWLEVDVWPSAAAIPAGV